MKTVPSKPKGFWFVPIDRKVIMDKSLSTRDFRVYAVLCLQAGEGRSVSLPVKKIGELANCKERTAQNALNALDARGLIRREKHFKNGLQLASTYYLIGCEAECYAGESQGVQVPADVAAQIFEPHAENCTGDGQNSAPRVLDIRSLRKEQENPTPLTPQGVEGEEKSLEVQKTEHDTAEQEKNPDTALAQAIIDAYHHILPELETVPKMTPFFAREIEARIREDPTRKNLAWWERYFRSIRDYPCPMGKSGLEWKANFKWLIGARGMGKVLDGKFKPAFSTKGGSESGWEMQKKFTNEEGEVDARALLRLG